jgi:hypothetical protein
VPKFLCDNPNAIHVTNVMTGEVVLVFDHGEIINRLVSRLVDEDESSKGSEP